MKIGLLSPWQSLARTVTPMRRSNVLHVGQAQMGGKPALCLLGSKGEENGPVPSPKEVKAEVIA